MNEIEEILVTRINEIRLVLELLNRIEQTNEIGTTKQTPTIKATLMLMYYNAIESTVYFSIQKIFDDIKDNCDSFYDLTEDIQKIYCAYYSSPKNPEHNNIYSLCKKGFDSLHNVTFEEYAKNVTIFSGNLDAKKIRDILRRFGINKNFHVKKEEKLIQIKGIRNKLAHGESSFNEIGRNYSYDDMQKFYDIVSFYLKEFTNIITTYLDRKQYLKQSNC